MDLIAAVNLRRVTVSREPREVLLTGLGADEVILYVDDDDSTRGSDRSRAAANRLYDSAGFCEIDRLASYC